MLPLIALLAMSASTNPPAPLAPIPAPRQLAWHKLETYAFVHFGPNTFTGEEWGHGNEHESVFDPKHLDCRQWVHTFKKAGLAGVMITAKHHDGFCLWPSKFSTHTVAQSHWKNGKGDVLKELSKACKAEGLKFGVYLSPWDRNHPTYGTPAYNDTFKHMLREVLTNYGDVFEVWFDGANGEGPNGKRQVYDWPGFIQVVRECQPNAVIFSDAGPDIRWVGNEEGHSAPTCWATIDRDRYVPGTPLSAELTEGKRDGTHWVPAECDVSIRPGWFHRDSEDAKVKSPEKLLEIWEESVGQNGNLILNVPPNHEGLISHPDVEALLGWKNLRDVIYGHDLAKGAKAKADASRDGFDAQGIVDGKEATYWAAPDNVTKAAIVFDLPRSATFDRVELDEQIALGQRIAQFRIEAEAGGVWKTIGEGTTVGHRRIVRVPVTTANRIRISILDSRACPTLSRFALYNSAQR
ncbi:alpha-L-fucosidase [Fimbriimonas ginsengisoli]|uniref:alpha-L-fucosidase n=1 Tax=Fimbriimonas ginsengisoli Gsoil 348 TaxID=661478 RepID=A0A068NSK9_FIMGI|nr:alpha-L-fucosidase [Fimbriimonas ginsengisoli]AIE85760.1 coagulation factor 5/8 type domain protein [Fimbriimonas ginsengisoli Gsoil 348]